MDGVRRRPTGAGLGLAIGALNVVVVAIVIAVYEGAAEAALLVGIYGGLPGVIAGTVLGAIAVRLGHQAPLLRTAVIAVPALGLVVYLGRYFEVEALIGPSVLPTFAAVLLLERATRAPIEEPLPIALAR